MTAVEPFASVSAMWQAHQMYATKNTATINDENIFLLPPLEATQRFRRPHCHQHLLSIRVRAIQTNRARNATPMS